MPGYKLAAPGNQEKERMATTRIIEIVERDRIVTGLAHVRREWEGATDGSSLVEALGSIGLILVDISDAIGLTSDEKTRALGSKLLKEAKEA
jgi:hypothetical protein